MFYFVCDLVNGCAKKRFSRAKDSRALCTRQYQTFPPLRMENHCFLAVGLEFRMMVGHAA